MSVWRQYYRTKYLDEKGYKVTVISLKNDVDISSDGKFTDTIILKERIFSNSEIIRVPYSGTKGLNFIQRILFRIANSGKNKWGSKFFDQLEFILLPINYSFRLWIEPTKILQYFSSRPDIILASGDPWSIHDQGLKLAKFFDCKFVAEYRDPWNYIDDQFKIEGFNSYNKNLWSQIKRKISLKRERSINSQADGIISVSEIWTKNAAEVTKVKKYRTITNGFEPAEYEKIPRIPFSKFTLAYTGHLYPKQKIDIFIKGLNLFVEDVPQAKKELEVLFLGALDGHGFDKRLNEIRKLDVHKLIRCTNRTDKKRSQLTQLSSNVLLYFTHTGTKGVYSGKIFEYLGARKPIILTPGDKDILDELIIKTNVGVICNKEEEIAGLLKRWFNDWKNKREVSIYPNLDEVIKFSYYNKVNELIDFIENDID